MLDEKNLEVLKKFMANNQQTPNPNEALIQEEKAASTSLQQFPQIGDIVTFGCWPFSANGESRPVEWIALRVFEKDQIAFLISENCIDCQPCDESQEMSSGLMTWRAEGKNNSTLSPYSYRWSKSSLLAWLKNEFYEKCFNSEEKARILSQTINEGEERISTPINLLSASQVLTLLPRPYERQAKGTPYCMKGAGTEDGLMAWWLSDSTEFDTDAAAVFADGSVCVRSSDESNWCDQNSEKSPKPKRPICHGVSVNAAIGIRPVIRIKFDNSEV